MLITKNSDYALGLDISDLSLKFVQLNKKGDKIKIEAMGRIDLPPGIIDNGEIKDRAAVIQAIKKMLDKPKFGSVTASAVAACLPETKTFIKLIKVEKTPNKIANVIENEIEKHIPLATKDMYYDWQIINQQAEFYEILIGAAPKNIVDEYIELLSAAKLSVIALEVESVPLCRCLLPEESPKFKQSTPHNYGLLDIGAKRTNLSIYAKNSIALSVSMPISGDNITSRIAETLEITKEQAEKAKIICGLDKDIARGIIKEILKDMVGDLIGKINEAIEFYNNHYADFGPINQIIVCGGGANIKNIEKIIAAEIGVEAILGNPFLHISKVPEKLLHGLEEKHNLALSIDKNTSYNDLSIVQSSALTYTTAIGLALRNIFLNLK